MTTPQRSRREQQAHDEIGHTEVRRGTAIALVAAFLAVLAVGTVTSFVPADARQAVLRLGAGLRDGARTIASDPSFGGLMRANHGLLAVIDEVEERIEDSSPWRRATLGPMQWTMTRWGGVGNDQVLLGTDERLAFTPGVDYVLGRPFLDPGVMRRRRAATSSWLPPVSPDPRPALIDFHRQLAANGIHLVLLPVPSKPMIDPRSVGVAASRSRTLDAAALHNPSFTRLRDDLAAAGIDVFDPTQALVATQAGGVDAFLRTDSHWSPDGMAAVAQSLAEHLESLGVDLGPRRALRRGAAEVTGLGDLARLLVAEQAEPFLAPETTTIRPVTRADGAVWQAENEAAILLLGDSFTNVYAVDSLGWGTGAGFAEQLAFALGRAVDRLAVDGGGATEVRQRLAQALAAQPAGTGSRLATKRVVVFEIAVRELTGGDWQRVALPDPAPPGQREQPAETRQEPFAFTATIRARSDAPRPGATPYREALVAFHLVDIRSGDSVSRNDDLPREALAYAWGLRDGALTATDRLRTGQRVEGTLVPWSAVAADMESVQRVELADPDLFLLETFWMDLP